MNILRYRSTSTKWHALVLLVVPAVLAGCQSGEDRAVEAVYTVGDYDPARNPADDLAATIRDAQASHKRILIQVGGQWCGWCHRLDKFIAEHAAVATAVHDHFIIMKVNYSDENQNAEFLGQYPEIPGYPHLFVLESDGTLLHSQPTAELEDGSSYSESALLNFFATWSGRPALAGL